MLAVHKFPKAFDGIFQLHIAALQARELLGDEEGLGKESLNLAGAGHGDFVFFGKLVHSQDGDNIL